MSFLSTWLRRALRHLLRPQDFDTENTPLRATEPPPPALPPGVEVADAASWTYWNDSGKKTGSNDYSEWHHLVQNILTPDGTEHDVDLGQRDWQEVSPGLWYRTLGRITEVVADRRVVPFPVVIRVHDYHWTGDQSGSCDGHHSKMVEHRLEASSSGERPA